jgi:hypothetical protein
LPPGEDSLDVPVVLRLQLGFATARMHGRILDPVHNPRSDRHLRWARILRPFLGGYVRRLIRRLQLEPVKAAEKRMRVRLERRSVP